MENEVKQEEKKQNYEFIGRTSGLASKDFMGYALVDFAGCLTFSLVTTILQKYYTDILLLSPWFIMWMFIGARVWDAINDPMMGRIADTLKVGKDGRYRPWLRWAAIPLAITTILMFIPWPGMTAADGAQPILTMIYATVTYVFYGMAYTTLQIPYGSLASVVTTDDKERNKLSIWRSAGAALGSIPVLILTSFFAYKTRVDASGNPVLGDNGLKIQDMQGLPVIIGVVIMSVIACGLLFVSFHLNKERVQTAPKPKREKGETWHIIKALVSNRSFLMISIAGMLLLAGQMFTQSYYLYLFNDFFSKNWMNLVSMVCTYGPMLITMFLAPKTARKFGKKEVCGVGGVLAGLANFALFFCKPLMPGAWWLFLFLCFVSGVGLSFMVLQIWAMATDAIDDIEVKTGLREDGTAYSVFMFFRKLGQVIAAVAVNGALIGMNYLVEKGAKQTPATLNVMYDLATIIPAVLFGLMGVVLLVWFPLSKKRVADLQGEKEKLLKEQFSSNKIGIAGEEKKEEKKEA
ncbi:MAG: glycoside-pentoside-hexuronide (GPH):cation symporter [Bacilli bacterium]|jgi:GPH family glycoside/pentoside/hexuronide:cation symporter|nr:glycoside-pentoside-hexuronide (GPH):cation symporter [Bacilli bacterium]